MGPEASAFAVGAGRCRPRAAPTGERHQFPGTDGGDHLPCDCAATAKGMTGGWSRTRRPPRSSAKCSSSAPRAQARPESGPVERAAGHVHVAEHLAYGEPVAGRLAPGVLFLIVV